MGKELGQNRGPTMYKVSGQHIVGSKEILDQRLVSETESSGRVASSKTVSWYDMEIMDE
jgi:hypothetical protein